MNDSRKIKKLEKSLIVASSMIANKDEILKDNKVKDKVDLGKKR